MCNETKQILAYNLAFLCVKFCDLRMNLQWISSSNFTLPPAPFINSYAHKGLDLFCFHARRLVLFNPWSKWFMHLVQISSRSLIPLNRLNHSTPAVPSSCWTLVLWSPTESSMEAWQWLIYYYFLNCISLFSLPPKASQWSSVLTLRKRLPSFLKCWSTITPPRTSSGKTFSKTGERCLKNTSESSNIQIQKQILSEQKLCLCNHSVSFAILLVLGSPHRKWHQRRRPRSQIWTSATSQKCTSTSRLSRKPESKCLKRRNW